MFLPHHRILCEPRLPGSGFPQNKGCFQKFILQIKKKQKNALCSQKYLLHRNSRDENVQACMSRGYFPNPIGDDIRYATTLFTPVNASVLWDVSNAVTNKRQGRHQRQQHNRHLPVIIDGIDVAGLKASGGEELG